MWVTPATPDGGSDSAFVPLFPLDTVLLPGAGMPLHIFEPRYRAMIADVTAVGSGRAFGLVMPPAVISGTAPGADGPSRALVSRVGTLAEVVEVVPYEDGRCDILTVGSRRFEILEVESRSKPYLRARVRWLAEDDGELTPALIAAARRAGVAYRSVMARASGVEPAEGEWSHDGFRLSYLLSATLRVPNYERQLLLEAPTAAERLTAALRLMHTEIGLVAATQTVPVSPAVFGVEATVN